MGAACSGSMAESDRQTVLVHYQLKITVTVLALDSAFTYIVIHNVPATYRYGISQK